eukprot:403361747
MSSGLYKESFISILEIENIYGKGSKSEQVIARNLKQVQKQDNSRQSFAEGATLYPKDNLIYQLTWKERKVFVYNLNDLTLNTTYDLPQPIREGWGLTHDQDYLYISEGTNKIYKVLPVPATDDQDSGISLDNNSQKLQIIETINTVAPQDRRLQLNELEIINETYIYANNYQTNQLYKIVKEDGRTVRVWDMQEIYDINRAYVESLGDGMKYDWGNNVMNGIAYNSKNGCFWITGKRWDHVYEVELTD